MTTARTMQRGGVGWYPHSGFIHIDTGPVRNWTLDARGLDGLLVFDGRRLKIDGQAKWCSAVRGSRSTCPSGSSCSASSPR